MSVSQLRQNIIELWQICKFINCNSCEGYRSVQYYCYFVYPATSKCAASTGTLTMAYGKQKSDQCFCVLFILFWLSLLSSYIYLFVSYFAEFKWKYKTNCKFICLLNIDSAAVGSIYIFDLFSVYFSFARSDHLCDNFVCYKYFHLFVYFLFQILLILQFNYDWEFFWLNVSYRQMQRFNVLVS